MDNGLLDRLPPLPPGFSLDQDPAAAPVDKIPSPPPGFTIDTPATAAPAPNVPPLPAGFTLDGVPAPGGAITPETPSPAPGAEKPGFIHGLKVGLQQLPESAMGTVDAAGYATGLKQGADLPVTAAPPADPHALAPTFTGFGDAFTKGHGPIDKLGNLVTQTKEVAGQSLAQFLPSIVLGTAGAAGGGAVGGPIGAAAGTAAGAFAGSYAQAPADILNNLREAALEYNAQPGLDEKDKFTNHDIGKFALELGVPVAAIDAIPEGHTVRKVVSDVAKEGVEALTKKGAMEFLKSRAKSYGKEAVKTGGEEGLTEGIQQGIQDAGQDAYVGKNPLTMDNLKDVAENAASGLVGGVTLGTGGKLAGDAIKAGKKVLPSQAPVTPQGDQVQRPADAQTPEPQAQSVPQTTEPTAVNQPSAVPAAPAEPEPPALPAAQPVETKQPTPENPPVNPVLPPENAPAGETKNLEPQKQETKKAVTPDGSMEVETRDEVVPAASLITSDHPQYDQTLQPRDREKTTSDLQVKKIASELDPERLADSRTTDQGAPIIGPDNQVESGNGRTAAIRQAYAAGGPAAEKYRQALIARGHNVDGIENPVLVRRRVTDLQPEDRAKFARLSNKSSIAEMSSTEKAKSDAAAISDDMVDLHKGGDIASLDNKDFVRSFIGKVATGNEAGALIGRDGQLTQEGEKRAKAAMVAKAYSDPDLVENIFDSPDPEVKSVGNVLRDRAPEFAQIGAAVRRKEVPERFDITKHLIDAVRLVRDARRDGKSVRDVIEGSKQQSMLAEKPIDPLTKKIVRSMFQPGLGRMLPQTSIDKVLKSYADTAREQKSGDLFGENKTQPGDLIDQAYKKVTDELDAKKNGSPSLFDAGSAQAIEDSEPLENSRKPKAPAANTGTGELAKTGGRTFEKFARNTDVNINKQVFEDIGIDPDKAVNMAPNKQLDLIKGAIQDKFGLKIELSPKVAIKDHIDQLMDMYVGMNNMAYAMGLPARAMSLDGNLTLSLETKRPYLGVYDPNTKKIGIPDKSNSYVHEWLHALDHHLIEKYGSLTGDLYSGKVRKEGVADTNNPVQKAFVNLMNSLFFDKAGLSAKILELENKAATGRTEKSRAEAQETLDQINAGNYHGLKVKNDYDRKARQMPGDTSYWASPEEMMARALEAYMGSKLQELGVSSRGISKEDVGYLSNADERLAKSFPKALDRMHIFEQFDNFFSALGEAEIVGKDAGDLELQKNPMYLGAFDPRYWEKTMPNQPTNWLRRQLEQVRADIRTERIQRENKKIEQANRKAIEEKVNPKDKSLQGLMKTIAYSPAMTAWHYVWRTERTSAHALEKKYPGITQIRQLNDRIFTRPGDANPVSETHNTELARRVNRSSTELEGIMKQHGFQDMTLADKDQLRNAFLGLDVKMPDGSKFTEKQITQTAAKLRQFSDERWKEMQQAGFDIGYVKDGAWLRRYYLRDNVLADPEGFNENAQKVYADQFNETFPDVDTAMKRLGDMMDLINGILKSDPQAKIINKQMIEDLQAAIKAKDKDAIRKVIEDNFDSIRDQYAQMAANAWQENITQDALGSQFDSSFPTPGFMKGRALPASADVHMKNFMETNVERILFHYMASSSAAITNKKVFTPKGQPSMRQLLDQAVRAGMTKDDAENLENSITRVVLGKKLGPVERQAGKVVSVMRMGGILMNLNKVVISAVTEPFVVGLKTRSVVNGFKAYKDALADMVGTNEAKHFQEVARIIGAIGTDYADMMQQERMGGGFETGLLSQHTMAKFFRYTGNTGITNVQSRVAIRAGYRWMGWMADKALNGTDREKAQARRDFAELGIPENQVKDFSEWLQLNDGRPNLTQELANSNNVYGPMFMTAMNRFRDQAVQHPKKEDRPALANHPVGSVLYTGLGFTFSFWDNVVKAESKKIATMVKEGDHGAAAVTLANHFGTIGSMIVLSYLLNTMRMAIFDHDKYEELKDDDPDKLHGMILGRALDNLNPSPAYSVLWNAYRGVDYGKDVLTSFSGLVLSNYANLLQTMFALGGDKNSPRNDNAEREVAKQAYRVVGAPLLTAALLNAPGPMKLLAAPIGVASMFLNSNTTADRVADTLVGPKVKGNHSNGEKEPKEKREPKEPK